MSGKSKHTEQTTALLLEVANRMAGCVTLDEALHTLVDLATTYLDCERATIFIHDKQKGELYSRVAQGDLTREIRILDHSGVAGWVFRHNEELIVHDAYVDERFNQKVDQHTGFTTKNILCTPLRTVRGEILGVCQALNKHKGRFTKRDLALFTAMSQQAALACQSRMVLEEMNKAREQELAFMEVVSELQGEIKLGRLLQKVISNITHMLEAERSTLFINDPKSNELYTEIGEGLGKVSIRLPNHLGIAGTVFTSGETVNIPHAYADLRFNASFDKQTGFFTRSMLCTPVRNKFGTVIGVTQVLNKKGGPFTEEDEARLVAFTSQIAMSLENAKLFDDVQALKNYNESMLHSMSNGVITFNEEGEVVTCNGAGCRLLELNDESLIVKKPATELFTGKNKWLAAKVLKVQNCADNTFSESVMDANLDFGKETKAVNVTLLPLLSEKQERIGSMVVFEDISSEKRMKSTMSRYMDADLADKLLKEDSEKLGGVNSLATVLFSDIRSFTTLTEELGAEGTVSLLNEYFTMMVECVQAEGGMLDKFIGDATMALFGAPFAHEDDADRALRAAIKMMTGIRTFNEMRMAKGYMAVEHGVGLNTDLIVTGNIGSPKRMDYTAIGDGVNLASRIESLCKQYGAHILLSEFTLKALKATYRTRFVDKVVVKGKSEPVGVYEVLDYHTEESFPHALEVLGFFNAGMEYYLAQEWEKAIGQFNEALKANPNDVASTLYIDRCGHFQANPPPTDWQGVWVMTSK